MLARLWLVGKKINKEYFAENSSKLYSTHQILPSCSQVHIYPAPCLYTESGAVTSQYIKAPLWWRRVFITLKLVCRLTMTHNIALIGPRAAMTCLCSWAPNRLWQTKHYRNNKLNVCLWTHLNNDCSLTHPHNGCAHPVALTWLELLRRIFHREGFHSEKLRCYSSFHREECLT